MKTMEDKFPLKLSSKHLIEVLLRLSGEDIRIEDRLKQTLLEDSEFVYDFESQNYINGKLTITKEFVLDQSFKSLSIIISRYLLEKRIKILTSEELK